MIITIIIIDLINTIIIIIIIIIPLTTSIPHPVSTSSNMNNTNSQLSSNSSLQNIIIDKNKEINNLKSLNQNLTFHLSSLQSEQKSLQERLNQIESRFSNESQQ